MKKTREVSLGVWWIIANAKGWIFEIGDTRTHAIRKFVEAGADVPWKWWRGAGMTCIRVTIRPTPKRGRTK